MRFMNKIERWLLICGLLLIAFFVAAFIHRAVLSRMELQRFHDDSLNAASFNGQIRTSSGIQTGLRPLVTKANSGYEESLKEHFDPALAVLRIAKLQLRGTGSRRHG